jgi:hypothetical protein
MVEKLMWFRGSRVEADFPGIEVWNPFADSIRFRGKHPFNRFVNAITNWFYTSKRSSERATSRYRVGMRKTLIKRRVKSPLTITSAKGRWESVPTPEAIAAGKSPSATTNAVIIMGRSRRMAPSRMDWAMPPPSRRSSLT